LSYATPTAVPRRVPPADEVTALVLAAGQGLRLGLGPKAFLCLAPRETLLERAVRAVAPYASEVIVGVPVDDLPRATSLCDALATGSSCAVVPGGATRQETVARLLARATRPLVLLHEVARPFVTAELFEQVLAAAAETGAASLFLPLEARDSVALVDAAGRLGAALPKHKVIMLQTPHAYRRDALVAAHEQAARHGWNEEGTAALVQRAGQSVALVPGSAQNVKLTYPADLSADAAPAGSSDPSPPAAPTRARAGG
jgi:2-C-methyl-D-erythritol 4-phosphate cytidylyltransferase